MLPNCPQYIIAAFAVLRLGAVVVNINPSYTAREVLTVAADSGARIVITLDALAPLVQAVRAQTAIEHVIVTSWPDAPAAPPRRAWTIAAHAADLLAGPPPPEAAARPDRSERPRGAAVHGGTTGTPKGAMLTHANIWANVVQTESWTNPAYILGGQERYLVVIPYFHIYAFSVCMMVGLRIGALQIIHPKYDPEAVLASIRDFRPTYFPAVPTVFVSLLNHPEGRRVRARARAAVQQRRRAVPGRGDGGVRAADRPSAERGYGLSETSPVTHSTPQLAFRKMGTIGLPFPDTDMKIVDVETGERELPLGEVGELCVSGPQVMKGYWNKPEESARACARTRAAGSGSTPATSRGWTRTATPRSSSARRT